MSFTKNGDFPYLHRLSPWQSCTFPRHTASPDSKLALSFDGDFTAELFSVHSRKQTASSQIPWGGRSEVSHSWMSQFAIP